VSAEDGTFQIVGVPGGTYVVIASLKGYRRAELSEVEPSDQALSMVLVRSAAIRGVVADVATGEPVTSFKVDVKAEDDEEFRWGRRRQYDDAAGLFERGDLRPGVYKVAVSSPGFVPASMTVELYEGEVAEPRFALQRSGRLLGRVVDRATGQPLAGARVRLVADTTAVVDETPVKKGVPRVGDDATKVPEKSEAQLQAEDYSALRGHFVAARTGDSVESDGDGVFEINTVPPGPQVVIVTHDGYVQVVQRRVEVGLGELIELDFGLVGGLHLAGRVIDSRGAPLDGRRVFVRGVSAGNSRVRKTVKTDRNGHFRIEGLEKGTYRVMALREGGGRGSGGLNAQHLELEGSRTDLEFVMPD
jgi:5-hydroxyisourate hydrolase-like protein (transthyretin family)